MKKSARMDWEYSNIVEPIFQNKEFDKLSNIRHHNSTRMEHSIKVSYYSYVIAKYLKLNYESVAKAGLLHDFFTETTVDYKKIRDKVSFFTFKHPQDALINSKKHFELTTLEEDIITTHMFPLDIRVPKYAESWIVNMVDTWVSGIEFWKKVSYPIACAFNFYFIFFMYYIRMAI